MKKSTTNIIKDTLKRSKWEYMVQREALSTPECQEGVPSQGGQQREEHRLFQHAQVKHYLRLLRTLLMRLSGVHGSDTLV